MSELCPVCWNTADDHGRLEESGDVIYLHESGQFCLEGTSDDKSEADR